MKDKLREAFSEIKADDEMKLQMKNQLKERMEQKKIPFYRHLTYRVAIATIVLVALVGAGLATTSQKSVMAAYVQMEGAVQIGLTLDGDNQVVEATGINDAGKEVLMEVSAAGLSYDEALQQIMRCDAYESKQGEEPKITVDCEDEAQQSNLESTGEKACENYRKHYQKQQGRQDEAEQEEIGEQVENIVVEKGQGNENKQGNGNGQGNHEEEGGHGKGQGNHGNHGKKG